MPDISKMEHFIFQNTLQIAEETLLWGKVGAMWWWNPGKLHCPAKGEKEEQRGPKSESEKQNPKQVTKGQRNKSCSKSPTNHK